MTDFDPMDCGFCCAGGGRRLPNGALASCPLHGGPVDADDPHLPAILIGCRAGGHPMTDLTPDVAAAFTAEAVQLDLMADTLEAINRTDPSPETAGEIRAYRIVAGRLCNKASPTMEASR